MSDQSLSRFNVSADNLRAYDWQSVIAAMPIRQCHGYYDQLLAKSEEFKKNGDNVGTQVFALLGVVASFFPNYDTKGNPYGPLWRDGENRGPMAEDLAKSDLDALAGVIGEIKDAEFRARVGDILWECQRDHKAARVAVKAFVEAALQLETTDLWPPFAERLRRAFRLSVKLGFGKDLHQEVQKQIEDTIAKHSNNPKSGLLCANLMGSLLSQGLGDAAKYATICEKLANAFASENEWNFSHDYWELAAIWNNKNGNAVAEKNAKIEAAECWVRKAEQNLSSGKLGYGFSAHWMGMALDALRQAGASEHRKEAIHRAFVDLEKKALSETSPLKLDDAIMAQIDSLAEKTSKLASEHVKGRPFEEAVFRLAFMRSPCNADSIKQELQQNTGVWMQIVGSSTITETGKTAGRSAPMPFNAGPERDEWLNKNSFLWARQHSWPHEAGFWIEPARNQVVSEHPIRIGDFEFLLSYNPFIPPGREGIFAQGIQAGFFGDWLIATHLLIPQLEASIRYVFDQRGIVTSTLEADGTQKERDLGWLLYHPQTDEILTKEIAFNLKGILFEKFGCNLRNDMAHGLMSQGSFYSPASIYLWWLVLRLCCIGYRCRTKS